MAAKQDICLLDRLSDAHLDDARPFIHLVTSVCSVDALAMLSAASRWHHEHCRERMRQLHAEHVMMANDLANQLSRLSEPCCPGDPYSEPWQLLAHVRCLTIPTCMRSKHKHLLGKWLQAKGRLSHVNCVKCLSYVKNGQLIGWVELDAIRAGKPELMTPEERFTLEKLDTADGLLKTVLKHVAQGRSVV